MICSLRSSDLRRLVRSVHEWVISDVEDGWVLSTLAAAVLVILARPTRLDVTTASPGHPVVVVCSDGNNLHRTVVVV